MILSLGTPKRRVVTADGTIFFNDFNDTLHVDLQGEQHPIALNLGTSNWTVSDRDEVAFLFQADGVPCLAIVDPAARTRLFQPLRRHKLLNLLLWGDRFVAAIPGYLLMGRRQKSGALDWHGMRALDCGADFRFQLEDDGRLSYTKRGSCLRTFCDPDTHRTAAVFDGALLWNALFQNAFAKDHIPRLTDDFSFTLPALLAAFRTTAAQHPVTPCGLRLFALLSLLIQAGCEGPEPLPELITLDWELQYAALVNEPFPTMALMQRLLAAPDPAALRPGKLMQPQLLKWSRRFEDGTAVGKRAKPINKGSYSDLMMED